MNYSVTGSNYGDEGKGLAVDYIAASSEKILGIRHNGGAQSGHTVETEKERFVFHELSSGSFRGADTYWAAAFFPDLYKLRDEAEDFFSISGISPHVYTSPYSCFTTIDDILINMLLESSRGDGRHGSCGMGINEADLRKKAGFGINMKQLCGMSSSQLYNELRRIRSEYSVKRLIDTDVSVRKNSEYYEMLSDDNVLYNFSETVKRNSEAVTISENTADLFERYSDLVFESGQGLRLDADFKENWPHVTASRTGIANVLDVLSECNRKLDKAVYVTRSYLTRHGAGPLKNEIMRPDTVERDLTNVSNPWQGNFRYARFDSTEEFFRVISSDIQRCPYPLKTALFITHLNETASKLLFSEKEYPVNIFLQECKEKEMFSEFMLSDTRYSDDVILRKH